MIDATKHRCKEHVSQNMAIKGRGYVLPIKGASLIKLFVKFASPSSTGGGRPEADVPYKGELASTLVARGNDAVQSLQYRVGIKGDVAN